jgi:hypothetical protein
MGQELRKIRGTLALMGGYQVPVIVRDQNGVQKQMLVGREEADKLNLAGYIIQFQ